MKYELLIKRYSLGIWQQLPIFKLFAIYKYCLLSERIPSQNDHGKPCTMFDEEKNKATSQLDWLDVIDQ